MAETGSGSSISPGSASAEVRNLNVKKAVKLEIRHSMIGFRNTLIFYTFKDHQAILQLSIGNKDESFPVTGKVYLFDKKTTDEGLEKWINNQHSDGLYPDIPHPTFTGELPDGSCVVTAHKQLGVTTDTGLRKVDFKNFEVDLSIKAYQVDDQFTLSAFTDSSKVYVE